jgi:hypothetical protein
MELEPVRHAIIHRHRECIVMAKGGIRQMRPLGILGAFGGN